MELAENVAPDQPSIGQVLESSTILPPKSAQDSSELKPWQINEQKRHDEASIRCRNSVWKSLCEARGPRYNQATFASFEAGTPAQQAAKAAVTDYAKDIDARIEAGQNVVFIGPTGTGKDHLMFALCHPAIGAFKTLLWINGTALWLAFRDAIGQERRQRCVGRLYEYDTFDGSIDGSESQIIDKLSSVDVLAISDPLPPGSSLTDYQTGNLLEIIDRRYSHLRPTWMTVNVANRKEAETRMGAPTVDRLCHDALTVVCDWPSYRQKKADAV